MNIFKRISAKVKERLASWFVKAGAARAPSQYTIQDVFKNKDGQTFHYVREIKEFDDLIIVRLQGAIDTYSIPLMTAEFEDHSYRPPNKNILLDFKKVTHVDSATLASLIRLLNELKHEEKRLGIIHATRRLKNYFKISRLEFMFKIYESESAALQELHPQGVRRPIVR